MPDTLAIQPIDAFQASVTPPGSKSLTNRALLLAALADGTSTLTGVLFADDTQRMLEALVQLGLELDIDETACRVTITGCGGRFGPTHKPVFLGNAGTATRFLTAALCLGDGPYEIRGIERMHQRPIGELVEPLRQLGATVIYLDSEGFPPLRLEGGLSGGDGGGEITMAPTLSSQYISALLQVAPRTARGVTINFEGPVTSRPYVEMTLALMQQFGIDADVSPNFSRIAVPSQDVQPVTMTIEPDASNASYFLAAAAIVPGSKCTIEGLGRTSVQGDAAFADVLHRMGANLLFGRDFITVIAPPEGESLKGIDVDLGPMPDMAQTLACVALFADGPTTIRNVGNLRVKETDRIAALENELTKLGATVTVEGDDITIAPPADGVLRPATIDTYDDHRMAMSFAVVGLVSPGVVINDPACVNKTFPDYFHYLEQLRESRA